MRVNKRKSLALSMVAAIALAGCGAVATAAGLPAATTARLTSNTALPTTTSVIRLDGPLPVNSSVAALQNAFENVYDEVNPSVVTIEVVSQATSPFGRQQVQQGLGSGFVWDTKGNIVTNNHVIDGATQITVVFSDGTTAAATLVAADPQSDLAVIKVNVPASQFKPVHMGDSTQVQVGQLAVAIGNPFGEQSTMTTGVISALGRFLPTDLNASGPTYQIPDVIQTDTPINPGNSGGVLLDLSGNVIGVTSAIESSAGSNSGVGFAIPAEIVNRVVPALISNGHYDHPYLGLSGTDLTSDIATVMGLDASQRGALVATVTAGGPAATAGIQGSDSTATIGGQQEPVGGDVIIAINGQPVKTFNDLVSYLEASARVGDKVTLTILRNGKQMDISLMLGVRPATSSQTIGNQLQRSPFRSNPNQSNPFQNVPNQDQGTPTTGT